MAACTNHADRPGVGVCVRCRKVICSACCTRLEGINHCPACLGGLARRPEARPRGAFPAALGAGLVLAAAWVVLFALAWLGRGLLDR